MDETTPLLPDLNRDQAEPAHKGDLNIVDFDPSGDAENPMDWPMPYKWGIVTLLAVTAFTVTFTCISIVPIANLIVSDLDKGPPNKSASVLLVTIWELGEAAGPLLVAPLSEVYGRLPVIHTANCLFITAVGLTAISQSTNLLIAARFFEGTAVASNVLNPAIVGDIFATEQRGTAMSFIMVAPLIGGAIGPAISGAIAQRTGWRSTMWMCFGLAVACEVAFLICFRETYKVPILRRRAARLREETGIKSLRTKFDLDDGADGPSIWKSIMRPATVLFGSGVLQAVSLYGSIAFAYFYIMSTTLPDILENIYHLPPALTGLAFLTFSFGSAVTVIICNLGLDRIYIKLRDSHKGVGQPEYRLPLLIAGAFLFPFVVALYGWIPQIQLPLVVMLVAVTLLGLALMLGMLPVMAYVVDAFGIYSASAITAVIVTRCLMGTFLPLATEPLVDRFGYGFGFTVLGGVSLVMAPIPVAVMRYGSIWRQRSKYSSTPYEE